MLGGGGTKGSYQVGVLQKWILDDGLDYDIMCGVSVGAINIAQLAQSPRGELPIAFEKLRNMWLSIDNSKIFRPWKWFGMLSALWKHSIVDSTPIDDMLHLHINADMINKSGRLIRVGAVCLETGEYRFGTELDKNFVKWVAASSSYPPFFAPIKIEGRLWADGGLRNVTPIGEAIKLGATHIDVIMCSNPLLPLSYQDLKATPSVAIRSADIMLNQIMKHDLELTLLKNKLAEIDPKFKRVELRIIYPKIELTPNPLEFDSKKIAMMLQLGYEDVCDYDKMNQSQ